jgi:hypothetical protein
MLQELQELKWQKLQCLPRLLLEDVFIINMKFDLLKFQKILIRTLRNSVIHLRC